MNLVKIYGDTLSQCVRRVLYFCKENSIPYTFVNIDLIKGEHLKADYLKINPNHKVPSMVDTIVENGQTETYTLFESNSIMRYLFYKHKVDDHWYPSKITLRAKADSYLDWHLSQLRASISPYVVASYFIPYTQQKPVDAEQVRKAKETFENILNIFEKILQNLNHPFLLGDSISLPDLSIACEFSQVELCDFSYGPNFPLTVQYIQRVQNAITHYNDEDIIGRFKWMKSVYKK